MGGKQESSDTAAWKHLYGTYAVPESPEGMLKYGSVVRILSAVSNSTLFHSRNSWSFLHLGKIVHSTQKPWPNIAENYTVTGVVKNGCLVGVMSRMRMNITCYSTVASGQVEFKFAAIMFTCASHDYDVIGTSPPDWQRGWTRTSSCDDGLPNKFVLNSRLQAQYFISWVCSSTVGNNNDIVKSWNVNVWLLVYI